MKRRARALAGLLTALWSDRRGNTAIVFSLAAPALLMAGGAALDYSRAIQAKSNLQAIADGAALAGAQSMRLANATAQTTVQVVNTYVAAQARRTPAPITVAANVTTNSVVAVQLDQDVPGYLSRVANVINMHVTARAQARNAGTALPICMLGLSPSQGQAISVDVAGVSAPACQIYSDSTATDSVAVSNGGSITTGRVCSSGGATNDSTSRYTPAPQTDCPPLPDPLASRAAPSVGACMQTNLKITSGSQTLAPGVYCGGIELSGSANVTLSAGTYILKDGQLKVKAGATLSGTDVSIYLTGSNATLAVENGSGVSLTAPTFGAMAGILISEDRNAPFGQDHKFESRNAPNMLGTIYLPRGNLKVGVRGAGGGSGVGVGSTSAWTIVVAQSVEVTDQQQLVLNANFGATTVPPPAPLAAGTGISQLVQ